MNVKVLLKFTFLFLTIGCQTFVFSAQPSFGENDQKEDKSVTSLSLSDLESEIKLLASEFLPANEAKEANVEGDVQDTEGSMSLEHSELFQSYRQSRAMRIKELKQKSGPVIPVLKAVMPAVVGKLERILESLNPDDSLTYEKELDASRQILWCVSEYVNNIGLVSKRLTVNDKRYSFIKNFLLPYVQVCKRQFFAISQELNAMRADTLSRAQEATDSLFKNQAASKEKSNMIEFLWSELNVSYKKICYKKIDELRKKHDENKQILKEIQQGWLRTIKSLKKIIKKN